VVLIVMTTPRSCKRYRTSTPTDPIGSTVIGAIPTIGDR
jgi:hypothetical protein